MSDMNGMTLSDDAPVPVRALVDTANARDEDGFVALFTPDALLAHRDDQVRGRDALAAARVLRYLGGGTRLELVGVKPGASDQEVVATVVVTGGGPTGTYEAQVTLRGDEIARLVVT